MANCSDIASSDFETETDSTQQTLIRKHLQASKTSKSKCKRWYTQVELKLSDKSDIIAKNKEVYNT